MGLDNLFIPTLSSISCYRISDDSLIFLGHEDKEMTLHYTSDNGITWTAKNIPNPQLQKAMSIQEIVDQAWEAIREMELLLAQDEPSPFELKEVQTA